MICYHNIKKSYGDKIVLDIKDFCLDKGLYGLKGLNGSGKSTLCKILAKIEKPDIRLDYPDIKVGYMPQTSYAFDMKVIDNVFLGADKKAENNHEKINEYLKIFNLEIYKDSNAKKLSGGEKQKLSLIRLMLKKYDLLILDEPTSSMDAKSVKIAENEIIKYRDENDCTVLMVSHEEGELERMTDKIIYIENGIIKS